MGFYSWPAMLSAAAGCTVCVITHTHTHSLIINGSGSSCVSLLRCVLFCFIASRCVSERLSVIRQFELKYQMIKLIHTIFAAFANLCSFLIHSAAFTVQCSA